MLRVSRRWPRAATPLLAATLMATGFMAAPAAADSHRVITVNSTTDAPDDDPADGDCDTGETADAMQCTLRAAVMEADADDTNTEIVIEVPAGTYELTEDGTTDSGADGDLYLSDANKSADTSYTIVGTGGTPVIDASGLGGDDLTDRILRIVDADGNDRVLDVTLSNLELTGGFAVGGSTDGGAVLVSGDSTTDAPTTVRAEQVHAHGNRAGYWGGAFAHFDSELTIIDSVLEGNEADEGGAIYTGAAPPSPPSVLTVAASDIVDNVADEQGGGVWIGNPDIAVFDDVTFRGNRVTGQALGDGGGAIWMLGSEVTVTNSRFEDNASADGGAVFNANGTLDVSASTFTNNHATCTSLECTADGGAIWTSGLETLYIAGSSFVGNTATTEGGALYVDTDDVSVTNSTFAGNEASAGGAILNDSGFVWLTRATVARNHATTTDAVGGSGGGVRTEGGSTVFENAVVAENTVGDGTLENCGEQEPNQLTSAGHNVSDDTTCFSDGEATGDRAGVDAGLATVDTSGATAVVPLAGSSPAVDIGASGKTSGECPTASEVHLDEADRDQRGAPAPVDGDADGETACDAGAFEFQPNVVTVQATTDGSEAGPTDGSVTLAREGDTQAALTVAHTVAGTATAGSDYTALSGTATFAAGATTTVVSVEVIDDDEVEDDETVELVLDASTGYAVGSPGTGTVTIADDDEADGVQRLDGRDRIDTAVLVSQRSFPDGADVVVIARSDVYADALAGGPFAHQVEAPILVTPPTQLRDEVATEIARLGATRAVILGGPIAITPQVEDQIADELGLTTSRLAGPDRFATAADIADEVGGDHVYVTEGDNPDPNRGWPDAVSVAPVAAHQNHPILFVRSDVLPEPTRAQLQSQAPSSATVIGGELAVSDSVASEVDAIVGDVDRVGGATRFHTAVAVADLGLAAGLSADTLWVARGDGWVDALVAGPAVARAGDSFVLVPSSDLDVAPVVQDWIADHADTITEIVIAGGPVAVSELVAQQLADLVG